MSLSTPDLMEQLNSVVSVPIVPFRGDHEIDYEAHAKNLTYLMENNHLEGDRRRVVTIAGTSLIHHISREDQVKLMDFTGSHLAGEGVLISGIVPNPIGDAGNLVEAQSKLRFPPDVYLLMPLTGVQNSQGLYELYIQFAEKYGVSCNARFIYYLRNKAELEVAIRLINESPYVIGVKIGTDEADVTPAVEGVDGDSGMVIWGIGDRCTEPAEKGTTGHTSGINLVVARASDEMNNAQRRGDYEASRQIEAHIAPLEDIRFRDSRMYNYSAVVEAIHLGRFEDVAGGEGGPFNPRVPEEVAAEVKVALELLEQYH